MTPLPSTVILSLPSLFSLPTDLPTTHFPHTLTGQVVWEQGCGVCSHSVGSGGWAQDQAEGSFNDTYWEGSEALSVSLEFTTEAGTVW